MYNLLLRESFEIRPVRRHRRTEGSVTSSQAEDSPGDRTDRTQLGIHYPRVRDFHGSFASFTPLLRQGFFAY